MTYNTELSERIEKVLDSVTNGEYIGKKMFGGIGYMVQGNMACGIQEDHLIVRIGKDAHEEALSKKGVSEFMNNGRPMIGWLTIEGSVLQNDGDLEEWISMGVNFALTLPRK